MTDFDTPNFLPDMHRKLIIALNVWRAARKGFLVPQKQEIDPVTMPSLLRSTFLFRAKPAEGDITCLLAGEDINRAWGKPIKGCSLRDLMGENDYPIILERWKRMLETPLILYGRKTERFSTTSIWSQERLVMPLTSTDDRPDHVFGVTIY